MRARAVAPVILRERFLVVPPRIHRKPDVTFVVLVCIPYYARYFCLLEAFAQLKKWFPGSGVENISRDRRGLHKSRVFISAGVGGRIDGVSCLTTPHSFLGPPRLFIRGTFHVTRLILFLGSLFCRARRSFGALYRELGCFMSYWIPAERTAACAACEGFA